MQASKIICVTLLSLGAYAPVVHAVTAVSNLANADPPTLLGFSGSPPTGNVSTSFTTGDSPAILNSATFDVAKVTENFPTHYFGSITTDDAGHPGAILEAFPTFLSPSQFHIALTFTSTGDLLLQPHTTYWLTLGSDFGGWWYSSQLTTEQSDYGWTIGDDFVGLTSDGWTSSTPFIGRFSVDATFVPEPSSAILLISTATLSLSRRLRKQPCRRTVRASVSL